VAYGELLFQHDFKAGEKSASFTVEKTDTVSPPFPAKVSARFVPERLDDFAWENDKLAHRTYGPALAAPAPAGSNKEVLKTSGLDIWFKRVPYPIVDRWYNIGHDHYHTDEGEGIDMYNVGASLGAGGSGIWDGSRLASAINFTRWKVIANGPVRAIFELALRGLGCRRHPGRGSQALHRRCRPLFRPHRQQLHLRSRPASDGGRGPEPGPERQG
jgi:hypothetical protein